MCCVTLLYSAACGQTFIDKIIEGIIATILGELDLAINLHVNCRKDIANKHIFLFEKELLKIMAEFVNASLSALSPSDKQFHDQFVIVQSGNTEEQLNVSFISFFYFTST